MRRSLALVSLIAILLAVPPAVLAQDAVRNGEIVKIDAEAKSFVVKTARGETTVETTDQTVVKEGEKTLTFEDLKVGDQVKVTGMRKEANVEAREIERQP